VRVNAAHGWPESVAGAAYLVRETADSPTQDTFVIAVLQARAPESKRLPRDGALIGTNFSYNDFTQLANASSARRPSSKARRNRQAPDLRGLVKR